MRLFKRKHQPEPIPCPRCGQLVSEDAGSVCPMCGWDVHDAYQGPASNAAAGAQVTGAPSGGRGDAV
jgi:ribosomal protein L37E